MSISFAATKVTALIEPHGIWIPVLSTNIADCQPNHSLCKPGPSSALFARRVVYGFRIHLPILLIPILSSPGEREFGNFKVENRCYGKSEEV